MQMTSLLIFTLLPIALTLVFFGCFMYENYNSNGKKVEKLKHKYLNYFFYLTYLVLPSTSTVIFQTFPRTDVDPDNEDDDNYDFYLTADMSIHCSGSYYNLYRVYASVMILVYPIGIPAMYLWLLYKHKDEIMTRDTGHHHQNNVVVVQEAEANGSYSSDDHKRIDGKQPSERLQKRQDTDDLKKFVITDTKKLLEAEDDHNDDDDDENNNDNNDDVLSSGRFTTNPVVARAAASNTCTTKHVDDKDNVEDKKNVTDSTNNDRANVGVVELSASAATLEFLFTAYEPQYWYWEVVETVRRLLLTAVLSVCGRGTSEQYIYGIILAAICVRLYSSYKPYGEDNTVSSK